MINQPLTSADHAKLVIFILLSLPGLVLLIGAFPALLLVFGIFMMKKNEDFSYIETTVKVARGYTILVVFAAIAVDLYLIDNGIDRMNRSEYSYYESDWFIASILLLSAPIAYLVVLNWLFYSPLSRHREWVEKNSIFSNKPRSAEDDADHEVDIIKGEKLKRYSVADELAKWVKLREDGHISEDEFNEARAKLLKRD